MRRARLKRCQRLQSVTETRILRLRLQDLFLRVQIEIDDAQGIPREFRIELFDVLLIIPEIGYDDEVLLLILLAEFPQQSIIDTNALKLSALSHVIPVPLYEHSLF